jgi:hypothetical protein
MRTILATLLLAVLFVASAPAQTAPHRYAYRHIVHRPVYQHRVVAHHNVTPLRHARKLAAHTAKTKTIHWFGPDIRPAGLWCGWFLRQLFGVADRSYNWAPNWAHWGHPLDGPKVGAVVVWRGHVGLIEGGPDTRGKWLVRSGNDGNAVRTRYLSIAKAIAFRMP